MRGGIRLRHPTYTAPVVYVVETQIPAVKGQKPCQLCPRTTHTTYTVHFRLDQHGCDIVSHEVYAKLLTVPGLGGMELAGAVLDPPTRVVGAIAQGQLEVITPHRADWLAPITRWRSRDKMHAPFTPLLEAAAEREDRARTAALAEVRTIIPLGKG